MSLQPSLEQLAKQMELSGTPSRELVGETVSYIIEKMRRGGIEDKEIVQHIHVYFLNVISASREIINWIEERGMA